MTGEGGWEDYKCRYKKYFICQNIHMMRGNTSLVLAYTKSQLTFSSFNVWYTYQFTSKELIDSSEDLVMTGFRLSWFIQSNNRTELAESTSMTDWKPIANVPKYKEPYLIRIVELVSQARAKSLLKEGLINDYLQEKASMMREKNLIESWCRNVLLLPSYSYKTIFARLNQSNGFQDITKEDINIGADIFFILTYCPDRETLLLYQFLHNLISTKSTRTIIQSTVNTLESENIVEETNKIFMRQFYVALDKIFNFQFGKILLATTPLSELNEMLEKELPYFSHYSQEIDQCLNDASCRGLQEVLITLGEINEMHYIYNIQILSQILMLGNLAFTLHT